MFVIRKELQLGALAVSALLLADVAHAQQVARDPDETSAKNEKQQVRSRLRQPTPEEVAALLKGMERSLSQSSEGLTVRSLPSGAVAIDLDGRFESVAVARIAPDGTVAAECVTTESEAREFLNRDLSQARAAPAVDSHAAPHAPVKAPADKTAVLEEK